MKEDIEIIQEVLEGDRNAFAHIVRKYEVRVRGLCLTMFANQSLAEDAAQEVFIKVYQALSKFRQDSSFSTWLYRIAVNHCKDILRKLARAKSESWDALLEREGEKIETLFTTPPSSAGETDPSELIAKLLSHLPEKSRTILILREIQGLSYQEIAETLKCSLDSVKARLKRAREALTEKARHFIRPENV
jgi:RNA polymerase sigma-70 factor (ECF subfamily)